MVFLEWMFSSMLGSPIVVCLQCTVVPVFISTIFGLMNKEFFFLAFIFFAFQVVHEQSRTGPYVAFFCCS